MAFLTEKMDMDFKGVTYATINNSSNTYATSLAVDMKDALKAVFCVNALSVATGGAVAWKIQESATTTTGDFADLSGYTAAHTDAEDDTWKTIEVPARAMTSTKRYLRLVATETGTQNAIITSVVVREFNLSNV